MAVQANDVRSRGYSRHGLTGRKRLQVTHSGRGRTVFYNSQERYSGGTENGIRLASLRITLRPVTL